MAGDPKTYTQDEVDAMVAERLEKEVAGLKANQQEALKELKAARLKLSNYDGVDPEEFKRLKSIVDEAERKKAAAEGDFKKLEAQLIERHQGELKGRDGKIDKLTKALERRAIRAELQAALVKAGAFKDELDLLTDYGERYARLKEADDDFVPYLVQPDGTPMLKDGQGTPMDFGTFAETVVKTKYPRLFEGTGSSGGGAPKSNGGAGGTGKVFNPATADMQEFMRHVEAIHKGEMSVKDVA